MGQRNEQEKGKETYPPAPSVEDGDTSPSDHDIDDDPEELGEEYIQAYLTFKRLRDSDPHDQNPDQDGDGGGEDMQIYFGTDTPETHSTPSTSSSTPIPPFPLSPPCAHALNQLERSKGKAPSDYPPLERVPQHNSTRDGYDYLTPRITYPETLPPRQVVPFHPRYSHPAPPPQSRYPGYARYTTASPPRLTQGPYYRSPHDTMAEYRGYNSGPVNLHPSRFSHGMQTTSRYIPRPYRTMPDGNRVYNLADERVLARQYRGGYNGYNDYNDYDDYSRGVGGSSSKVETAYTARGETNHTGGTAMAQGRAEMALFEAFAEVCNVTSQIDRDVLAVKKMVEEATKGANDLSGMVRKRKVKAEDGAAAGGSGSVEEGKGKRKAEDVGDEVAGKKVKTEGQES